MRNRWIFLIAIGAGLGGYITGALCPRISLGERLGEPHYYSFGVSRRNSDHWDAEFVLSDDGRIRTIYFDDDGDGLAECALLLSYSPAMIKGATFDTDGDGLHDLTVIFDENGNWLKSEELGRNSPEAGPFRLGVEFGSGLKF